MRNGISFPPLWAGLLLPSNTSNNITSPHSVTLFSPLYLLTGEHTDPIPVSIRDHTDLVADRKLAFENSVKYHNYNKNRYDKLKNDVNFKVGDMTFIENGNILNRDKLDPVRVGPFKITRQLSNSVFEVHVGQGPLPRRLYHANKMLHVPVDTY